MKKRRDPADTIRWCDLCDGEHATSECPTAIDARQRVALGAPDDATAAAKYRAATETRVAREARRARSRVLASDAGAELTRWNRSVASWNQRQRRRKPAAEGTP